MFRGRKSGRKGARARAQTGARKPPPGQPVDDYKESTSHEPKEKEEEKKKK